MVQLFTPNYWDAEYYPEAKDLTYEVPSSLIGEINFLNVILTDNFPIRVTKKYLYQGNSFKPDSENYLSNSSVAFKTEVRIISEPKYGTLEYLGDKIRYKPRLGFVGKDTFRYCLVNTQRLSNVGTINLFVGTQAKYIACANPVTEISGTLAKDVLIEKSIYLCKPVYIEASVPLEFHLSNYLETVVPPPDPPVDPEPTSEEDPPPEVPEEPVRDPMREFTVALVSLDGKTYYATKLIKFNSDDILNSETLSSIVKDKIVCSVAKIQEFKLVIYTESTNYDSVDIVIPNFTFRQA